MLSASQCFESTCRCTLFYRKKSEVTKYASNFVLRLLVENVYSLMNKNIEKYYMMTRTTEATLHSMCEDGIVVDSRMLNQRSSVGELFKSTAGYIIIC